MMTNRRTLLAFMVLAATFTAMPDEAPAQTQKQTALTTPVAALTTPVATPVTALTTPIATPVAALPTPVATPVTAAPVTTRVAAGLTRKVSRLPSSRIEPVRPRELQPKAAAARPVARPVVSAGSPPAPSVARFPDPS